MSRVKKRVDGHETRNGREAAPAVQKQPSLLVPAMLAVLAIVALIGAGALILQPPSTARGASGSTAGGVTPTVALRTPGSTSAPAKPYSTSAPVGGKIAVRAEDGVVRLAASDFADGRARFYTYRGSTKTVTFFVLKSSDGVIRAAFDACDVCYAAKKGYRQEGDVMVCNNCGTRFPSVRINVEVGGCNPSPLQMQVQGDTILIKASDIEAGARFF